MKKLIVLCFLLSLITCLSSCSNYYYSTLSSNDRTGRYNANKNYVVENDSVLITYSFYGENAPLRITIFNKLNEPLYVDWERSALIIGDVATSFYQETVPIRGVTESVTSGGPYHWERQAYSSTTATTTGSFSGEMTLSKGTAFIPPKSKIASSILKLEKFPSNQLPAGEYREQSFTCVNGKEAKLKSMRFSEENSPLHFRIYLSLYTGKDQHQYSAFESSFYLSELIKGGRLKPAGFQAGQRKDGNFFYTCDVRGKCAGWIVLGTVLVAGAILIPVTIAASQPKTMPSF